MAVTLTITNKTHISLSTSVTKPSGTAVTVYVGAGNTKDDVVSNAVVSRSVAATGTSGTANFYTGLSQNTQYGAVAVSSTEYSDVLDATLPCRPPQASYSSSTTNSATISYTTEADGGYYPKQIKYSLDSGNTWTTATTIISGAAQNGTFTIAGLAANTEYTVQVMTSTTAGNSYGNSFAFATLPIRNKFYGSVNSHAEPTTKLYGSVNGQATQIKLYGSVNGQAKRIY